MHLSLISLGLLPFNFVLSASRAALPSVVLKSSTTALMSALVPGLVLAFANSVPPAKLSFKRPHSPLGSAAVMAIPAAITLSNRTFHSSGVKFDLFVMSIDSYNLRWPSASFDYGRRIGLGCKRQSNQRSKIDTVRVVPIGDFGPLIFSALASRIDGLTARGMTRPQPRNRTYASPDIVQRYWADWTLIQLQRPAVQLE